MCELTVEEYNKLYNTNLVNDSSKELLELNQRISDINKNKVIWLTGLSGAGKSTIADELIKRLVDKNRRAYNLDGDKLRSGINQDLSFSESDRKENIRRTAEIAKLFCNADADVVVSLISPYIIDRNQAKSIIGQDRFIEVHIHCAIDECEKRDPKGLYKKFRAGEINNFTGFDSPYEKPINPNIFLDTQKFTVDECVKMILNYMLI